MCIVKHRKKLSFTDNTSNINAGPKIKQIQIKALLKHRKI